MRRPFVVGLVGETFLQKPKQGRHRVRLAVANLTVEMVTTQKGDQLLADTPITSIIRTNMGTRNTSSAKKRKLKLSDAAAYLGVSPSKVSRLVKTGELKCADDPLDRRRKLVEVKALERLKLRSLAGE
jgi:hypothetical protein